MKEISIGSSKEQVYERSDYPADKIRAILGQETIAVLGYGVQGRGQSLNMRDNGLKVIIGLRDKGREVLVQLLKLDPREAAVKSLLAELDEQTAKRKPAASEGAAD